LKKLYVIASNHITMKNNELEEYRAPKSTLKKYVV